METYSKGSALRAREGGSDPTWRRSCLAELQDIGVNGRLLRKQHRTGLGGTRCFRTYVPQGNKKLRKRKKLTVKNFGILLALDLFTVCGL